MIYLIKQSAIKLYNKNCEHLVEFWFEEDGSYQDYDSDEFFNRHYYFEKDNIDFCYLDYEDEDYARLVIIYKSGEDIRFTSYDEYNDILINFWKNNIRSKQIQKIKERIVHESELKIN